MALSYNDIPEEPEEMKEFCRNLLDEITRLSSELRMKENDKKFYQAAIDNIPNPVFLKDEDGCIMLLNKEYAKRFGLNPLDYVGKTTLDMRFLKDALEIYHEEDALMLEGKGGDVYHDTSFEFADAKLHHCYYWSRCFKVDSTQEMGVVGEIVDITKERELENDLKKASMTDPGTGLFNRYVFDEQTKEIIKDARKNNTNVSVMMADLDHFKRVNDTFGHLEGDRVLKDFAEILRSNIRPVDVPIRYGGEEFLVFLYGTDLSMAASIAERIRETTEKSLFLPDGSTLTVSIGVVKFINEETRTQCIERADEALYTAKETGRNKVVVSDPNREDTKYMG